jgi:ABC-type amino acid transport substrate-binding protein/signal transduction histidine kinase/CheY-like chemotaxis protein
MLIALVFCPVAMFPVAACAGAYEAARVEEPPVSSAAEIDYPPFSIVGDNGRADGFSVELLRAVVQAMGRHVTFRAGSWVEVKGWLEQGEIQALPLVGRTPERESVFDFTFPYMSLHGAIVVRAGSNDIRDLRDLRGRRVAVMKGDNAEEFLRREERGVEIHTTTTFEDGLRELSEGRYDAVVIQRLVALRLIEEGGLANLRIVNEPIDGFRQDFCFAVKEGDRETLALLNEGLALVMADGTYRRLHAKWFAALELPSHRRIVIGGDHNYPPYEYLDEDGRPAGYNVELTRAIAKEVGLDIEIRLGPWSQILRSLENGEIDALQGIFYSSERDEKFDFTQPHTVNHCVSVVRKGAGSAPSTVAELAGRQIVVQQGDIMHDFALRNGLEDQLTVVDAQEDALRELAEGRHDCALVSRMTALYSIEKHGWKNLTIAGLPLLSPEYCYGALKNQKALLAQFGEGLQLIQKTGEYRRIHKKWLGAYEDSPPSLTTILRYIALAVGPLLLILSVFFTWSWSLRKQVASRTAELREREAFIRTVLDNLPIGIAVNSVDPVVSFDYMNDNFPRFYRTTREAISDPDVFWNTVYEEPEFREEMRKRVLDDCTSGDPDRMCWVDVPITRKGENPVYITARNIPLPEKRLLISTVWDVTERKLAEQRIQHLNRVLRGIRDVNQLIVRERNRDELIREACRQLVENRGYTSALIVLTDENDRPVSWSGEGPGKALEPLSVMSEQGELPPCCDLAKPIQEVVLISDWETVCSRCPIAGESAKADSLCVRLVHDGVGFGYLAVTLGHGLGVDAEERSLLAEMASDLAYALRVLQMDEAWERSEHKRKSLEDQLLQAQKMEAVGRLAGGVAHDYNNMLGVIIGYAGLGLDRLDASDPLYSDLEEILKAAKRSTDITRQLLAFARKQTIAPVPLDLNQTVEGMLKMLRRLIGEDINLAWLPKEGLWQVKMDPAQIDQILANLCVNARDAIAGVGKVTIETAKVTFDEAYCADHAGFLPGEFVMLAVSDDGCGMDKGTLENIFEPFFTTKDVDQGTGLGLATVYGIVKQNNGFINVYSEIGKGTTIKIYLARHAGAVVETKPESSAEIPRGQGEIVLLVEDEISMLNLTTRILERLDYFVLAAETPGEAMRLAAEHAGEIHLLITDVIMPEMNGRDLANQLQSLYPELKTLFMSGYTANVIAHRGVLDEGVHFIQKPFSMKELAGKIRETRDLK